MAKHYVVALGCACFVVLGLLLAMASRHARLPESAVSLASDKAVPQAEVRRAADGKVNPGPPSMLHLDPRHTNRSPFEGPTTPDLAWAFDGGAPIEAAPALLDDGTILVATLGGKLYGLTASGQVRYSADLGGRGYASPLVHGEGFYVGSDAHKFFGLSKDGVIRFRLETDADVDTGAAPTPWGGIVFASGKVLYASKPDGTLLWRFQARRKCYSSPAVGDDGTVYFGCQDHFLYAVLPAGKVKWRVDLRADVDGAPAIEDDGVIVVGTDNAEVISLMPDDGRVRWRADVGGYVRGALSLGRDGSILTGTYGPTPHLVALEPEDGRVRFRFAIRGSGSTEFGIHGGPVEDKTGRLYFGAQDDSVYCLGPDGALVWSFKTGGDVDAPLVITPDGLLLAGSDDGKLYALGAR